jgi:photosystem II stability/assembly factor-like uncharacterized protein
VSEYDGARWEVASEWRYTASIGIRQIVGMTDAWAIQSCTMAVLRTRDQGRTWERVNLFDQANVREIKFFDHQRGTIVAERGTWITEDGGDTWFELSPTPTPLPP